MRVYRQLELNQRMRFVDLQLGLGHGIVHPVVHIEAGNVLIAHTAAAHIRLIGQNQRRCQLIHRLTGPLVVVADRRDDQGDLLRRKTHLVQQAECHDGAALAVIHPVDQIADVVQIAGDLAQLHHALRVAQRLQDIPRLFRHQCDMSEAVLGKAQGDQRGVGLRDIGADYFVFSDLFVIHIVPSCLGNVTVTVVPPSTTLCSSILALCSLAACLTMDSPSPVPPTSLEWLLSTR